MRARQVRDTALVGALVGGLVQLGRRNSWQWRRQQEQWRQRQQRAKAAVAAVVVVVAGGGRAGASRVGLFGATTSPGARQGAWVGREREQQQQQQRHGRPFHGVLLRWEATETPRGSGGGATGLRWQRGVVVSCSWGHQAERLCGIQ